MISQKNTTSNTEASGMVKKFNDGHAAYIKGDLVSARSHLEKAYYNGMISEEADQALNLVKSELDLITMEREQGFQDKLILESNSFPEPFVPAIAALLLLMGLIAGIFRKKILSAFIILCSALVTVFFFQIKEMKILYNAEETIIYKGPSRIFEQVQQLPLGAKFIISKEVDDWKYVQYPAMFQGWIYKNKAIK